MQFAGESGSHSLIEHRTDTVLRGPLDAIPDSMVMAMVAQVAPGRQRTVQALCAKAKKAAKQQKPQGVKVRLKDCLITGAVLVCSSYSPQASKHNFPVQPTI